MPEQKHEFLFPNGDRKWLTVEDGAKLDKPEGSLLILITATLFKQLHDGDAGTGKAINVKFNLNASKN